MGMLFDPSDYDSLPAFLRTRRLTEAIVARYAYRAAHGRCVAFTELTSESGFSRIDVWVQFFFASDRYKRIAYEVKVSRADFKHELRNPVKRYFALSVSSEYYFATPPGLVQLHELPEEAGLVEIGPDGSWHVRKKAPRRDTSGPGWGFVGCLVRKAGRLPEQSN